MSHMMIWQFGKNPPDLIREIGESAKYYRVKYGTQPNAVWVNALRFPNMIERVFEQYHLPMVKSGYEDGVYIMGVNVRPSKTVLPNCLWLGIEEKP